MMEGILRRDDLEESMNDINLDEWKNLVVLCAANRYDGIKLADQHVAQQLARLTPVLYVDPTVSFAKVLSTRQNPWSQSSLRILGPGLARLTPAVQPFASRKGMIWLTSILALRLLRRATRRLGGDVQAVLSAWPLVPILGGCGERVKVYWAQDDFVGGAELFGLNPEVLRTRESQTAAAADFIIAANPGVAKTWRDRGYQPILIPFGADVASYEGIDRLSPAADVDLPAPIAGFIGHINERINLELLEAVALRGRSMLLIGPRKAAYEPARWNALLKRSNVRWLGPRRYEELPAYLKAIDVGLVPYGDSAFNRGSFPLKTFEYLAGGRPVVATSLPATRWLATDLVTMADEPTAFADAVDKWLFEPRTKAAMDARRAFAGRHSWAQRAKQIADVLTARSTPQIAT
jgi:glycosyltransferase involved in cell wall biosynthesis